MKTVKKLFTFVTQGSFLIIFATYQIAMSILRLFPEGNSYRFPLLVAGALLCTVLDYRARKNRNSKPNIMPQKITSQRGNLRLIQVRWVLLCIPLTNLFGTSVRDLAVLIFGLPASSPIISIVHRTSTAIFVFSVIFLVLSKFNIQLHELVGKVPAPSSTWLWPLISVPMFIVSLIAQPLYQSIISSISPWFSNYINSQPYSPSVYTLANTNHTLLVNIIMGLFLILITPAYEELLFRGIIFNRWIVKWGAPKAVIGSSLLFAALHYHNLLSALVFSLVISLLYLKTQSLYIPILCHSLHNALVFALILTNTFE